MRRTERHESQINLSFFVKLKSLCDVRARAYRFFSGFEKKSPTEGHDLFLEKALQENNNFDSGNRSPVEH